MTRLLFATLLFATLIAATLSACPAMASEDEGNANDEEWLTSLITETPAKGFDLAIRLSRRSVTTIQPDKSVLVAERPEYARDADGLIAASQVVAVYFQTIAAANEYWRD